MDQVTQQNAAMVEEATAASHSLAKEAETLGRLVSQFRLGGGAESGSAQAAGLKRPAAKPAQASRPAPAVKHSGGAPPRAPAPAPRAAPRPAPARSPAMASGDDDGWSEF